MLSRFSPATCTAAFSVTSNGAEVLAKWSHDDAALKKFAEIAAKYTEGCVHVESTYADGKYTIEVANVGYYLVHDHEGSAALNEATATDYIMQVAGNVTVTVKAVNPTFNKSVNTVLDSTYAEAISVQDGDRIYYKLETQMPSMLADYKQYHITFEETIPDFLTNGKLEAIYIQHQSGSTDLATKDADGVIISNDYYTNSSSGNTLKIEFNDILETYPGISINDKIVVKYSAEVVGEKLVIGNGGNVNTATLNFSNDMNQDSGTITMAEIEDSATVYSYGLTVTKQNAADKANLEDAQFVLYRDFVGSGIRYAKLTDGVISDWVANKEDATVMISDEFGNFSVKGLSGVSYYLEEIEPPAGFNQMDAPIVVTVKPTIDAAGELTGLAGTADTTPLTGETATGLLSMIVLNNPGTILPSTGGMGTTIFYIVGAALLLGSIVAIVAKKRGEA